MRQVSYFIISHLNLQNKSCTFSSACFLLSGFSLCLSCVGQILRFCSFTTNAETFNRLIQDCSLQRATPTSCGPSGPLIPLTCSDCGRKLQSSAFTTKYRFSRVLRCSTVSLRRRFSLRFCCSDAVPGSQVLVLCSTLLKHLFPPVCSL